ncbi:hypothetical protein EVJ58_g8543 [Rhodofomes roseus]|uniref:Exocyst complex component Sec10-like alpha-helical bundle domain-containing protein n=1 Tax=Rhodofomes roseus TaxID=34475 RepID=A0A4Y9XY01_9APHY|nr:hypothetical protein EVJ58_g8543 [Rhodofomes roseus]
MDKFTALEPVRLYNSPASSTPSSSSKRLSIFSPLTPRPAASSSSPFANAHLRQRGPAPFERIGRLPADLHILLLTHVAVPRPARGYAKNASANGRASTDSNAKGKGHLHEVLGVLEERSRERNGATKGGAPPTLTVDIGDDEFGDFASGAEGSAVLNAPADEMGDFVGAFSNTTIGTPRPGSAFPTFTSPPTPSAPSKPTFRAQYIRAHTLLEPLVPALYAPPHAVLSTLFPPSSSPSPSPFQTPLQQAHTLRLLALFLSSRVKPLRSWSALAAALRAATDRFEDALLTAFDVADGRADEAGMREAAEASWEVFDRSGSDGRSTTFGDRGSSGGELHWELGTVWIEKREIFYEQSKWRPLDNFTQDGELDFDAMDAFVGEVLGALREHGARAVRVFPPATGVLLAFADRLAGDVVGEYTAPLLTRARELSNETFLKACAASFKEAWRMADVILEVAAERSDSCVTKAQAEDVVYRMFEPNMDEYLDEEIEFVKGCFERTCRTWEVELLQQSGPAIPGQSKAAEHAHVRFIGSSNPAQVKRNVLASFADVLLLPVTIVPRTAATVGKAVVAGGSAAVQGISMLNPQKWGGTATGAANSAEGGSGGGIGKRFSKLSPWRQSRGSVDYKKNGYTQDFEKGKDGSTLFEIGDADEEADGDGEDEGEFVNADVDDEKTDQWSVSSSTTAHSQPAPSILSKTTSSSTSTSTRTSVPLPSPQPTSFDKFDLLLSIDVALELIHADRESLKRAETFSGYPGQYGHRVRDTIEEIFVLLLQALGERHVKPGFDSATQQMRTYQPAEHEETRSVAPLLQFFELVHMGDTIQSMVQVYFDKELAPHIDRTDFLNSVVREKKRFEDVLDDCVAAGLNAGTDALMNQVEHIISKLTGPRAYYPQEGAPLELGPTKGCVEAIQCLKMHCQLLKGSTSKEVLEVFYQEIGIRLIAILQKHLKRQIISLNGGFQVIADLNAYHTFIASLKVSSIASEFSYLKMLGHVYVVEDAKDLAQIVRDVTRYGGAYKPEDVYEFIQRRADWKRIEKTVDKTMYNLSFKEDCVIC